MFQILIVDDDKNTRHYLSTVLADAGYTPYTASSASEALLRRIYRMIATVASVEEEDIVCVPFMKENLYLAVPEDHELSGYRKLYLKDLKDLTIILHSRIGFWYDLCMREMVNPDFILQDDFDQFQILSRSTLLPYFVTSNLTRGLHPSTADINYRTGHGFIEETISSPVYTLRFLLSMQFRFIILPERFLHNPGKIFHLFIHHHRKSRPAVKETVPRRPVCA